MGLWVNDGGHAGFRRVKGKGQVNFLVRLLRIALGVSPTAH